jgi:hypothetical protein
MSLLLLRWMLFRPTKPFITVQTLHIECAWHERYEGLCRVFAMLACPFKEAQSRSFRADAYLRRP